MSTLLPSPSTTASSSPSSSSSPTQSTLHATLTTTSQTFLTAQSYNPLLPSLINFPLLTSLVTPSYSHTFGPTHYISTAPHLQGTFTMPQFITHLQSMLPNLESWDMHVLDTIVDKVQKKVVLRVRYEMRVRGYVGEEGVVQNEVEWWLEMDEDGGRVRSSREVVDGVAAGRIGELVRGRKEGGRRGEVS